MKLVEGAGVNDAGYQITRKNDDGTRWMCPYYRVWVDMLRRVFASRLHFVRPTYAPCELALEWQRFSVFRAWMLTQDWEGKELDKDLLKPGNKIYGPDFCVFVSTKINNFLTERGAARGDWPLGVSWHCRVKKFQASCQNPVTRKQEYLGYFAHPDQAHAAWKVRKLEHALTLATEQTDERVAMALVARYC